MKVSYLIGLLFCIYSLNTYSGYISQFQRIEGNTILFDVPVSIKGNPIEQLTIAIKNSSTHENYPFFPPVPLEVSFPIDNTTHNIFYISISYCNFDANDCLTYGGDLKEVVHKHKLRKLVLKQNHNISSGS